MAGSVSKRNTIVSVVRNSVIQRIKNHLIKEPTLTLVVVLFLMIFSRISITYLNETQHLRLPEWYFAWERTGHDWYYGTMNQAYRLIHQQPLDPKIGYGPSLAVVMVPIIKLAEAFRLCVPNQQLACSNSMYRSMIIISIIGYFILIFTIVRDNKKRTIAMILLVTFLLGIPGSRGLETGNVDILFSLISGIILLLLINQVHSYYRSVITSCIIGFLCGFLINTKAFLMLYALPVLISMPIPLVGTVMVVLSFLLFSIIPSWMGSTSSILFTFNSALAVINFPPNSTVGNVSIPSFITILTDSFFSSVETNSRFVIILLLSLLVSYFVLVFPIIRFIKYNRRDKNIQYYLLRMRYHRRNPTLILLLFIICNTIMILLSPITYEYRLYYLLPLIFFLLRYTQKDNSLYLTMTAIILLLVRSLWIGHFRTMNLFLYIHYYFLISAVISVQTRNKIHKYTNIIYA